jgi:hypothetical protein
MNKKIYRFCGIDTAVHLLRPDAKDWEIENSKFTKWTDERPQPTMQELKETQQLAKEFEDKLKTIWKDN